LVMPVMNGFKMVQVIQQTPDIQHIPIVAVSASVFEDDQEESFNMGFQGFLSKPVEAEKLFALLAQLFELEWIYETVNYQSNLLEKDQISEENIIPPPQQELEELYQLTMFGDLEKVQLKADQIENMNSKYRPFTQKVRAYAQKLEDEMILDLLTEYLDKQ
ncbi:MAG: response regulator, partial [Limnoraphis robusta]